MEELHSNHVASPIEIVSARSWTLLVDTKDIFSTDIGFFAMSQLEKKWGKGL